jgi:hypothetical protein
MSKQVSRITLNPHIDENGSLTQPPLKRVQRYVKKRTEQTNQAPSSTPPYWKATNLSNLSNSLSSAH